MTVDELVLHILLTLKGSTCEYPLFASLNPSAPTTGMAAFIPAARFAGSRQNYVFTTRDAKTGYYFDATDPRQPHDDGAPVEAQQSLDAESVDAILKRADLVEVNEVDNETARRLLLQLEKRMLRNRQLRVKYVDDPRRFVDSEVDLDEAIKEMSVLTSAPEVYGVLVECGGAGSISSLLLHENGDVRASACALLFDLTDPEASEGSEGGLGATRKLAAALVEANVVEMLASNLERFDETVAEESQATHDALGVLEHMYELEPASAQTSWRRAPELGQYLVSRVGRKGFDANKLYASEVLAIAVQRSEANARSLAANNLLDGLLQAANYYRRRSPGDEDEQECVANIFDALYAALTSAPSANAPLFARGEGVELMLRCAREGRHAAAGALKVLDAALSSFAPTYDDDCVATRLVANAGLKIVFPALAGKGAARPPKLERRPSLKRRRAKRHADDQRECDERVLAIVASLCFYAVPTAPDDARPRIVAKFAEQGKIDRLTHLVHRYGTDVLEQRRVEETLLPPDANPLQLAASQARLLRAGGHAVRLAAAALAFALANSPLCRERFRAKVRAEPSATIRPVDLAQLLVEYADDLDDRSSDFPIEQEGNSADDLRAASRVAELRAGALRDWAAAVAALDSATTLLPPRNAHEDA